MIYNLVSEKLEGKKLVRTYRNDQGSETKTSPIYTDAAGETWWGFMDLLKIPYIRMAYAQNLTNLFTVGLSLNDIVKWAEEERAILKSDAHDKIDRAIALSYEKEKIARQVADPVKQHLSLGTVYILKEDERIDAFDEGLSQQKFVLWSADPKSVTFFLNWLTGHTQSYLGRLEKISKTVLPLLNPNPRQTSGKK